MGMVVDSVSDVISLAEEQMKPAPEFSAALDTDYIIGLGIIDKRILILMDIEKLMTGQDMVLTDQALH